MKKELLLAILLATGSMAASFQSAAQWQDKSGEKPEDPPEELRAAAAAAAAPGAIPIKGGTASSAKAPELPGLNKVGAIAPTPPMVAPIPVPEVPFAVSAPEPVPVPVAVVEAVPAPAPAAPAPLPSAPPVVASEPEVLLAPVSAPPREEIRSVTPVVSTWNNAKATAVVLHPVTLRSRPVANGSGDPIDAETRVRLESSTINGDGTWWFVTAPGVGGGWLLESEMGSPQR